MKHFPASYFQPPLLAFLPLPDISVLLSCAKQTYSPLYHTIPLSHVYFSFLLFNLLISLLPLQCSNSQISSVWKRKDPLLIQFVSEHCPIFFLAFTYRLHEHSVHKPCPGAPVLQSAASLQILVLRSHHCLKNSSYLNQIPLNPSTSFNNTF